MEMPFTKPFMKLAEATKVYSIGKNILYDAIRDGKLRAYKPNGRDYLLKTTEIEKWIESFPV